MAVVGSEEVVKVEVDLAAERGALEATGVAMAVEVRVVVHTVEGGWGLPAERA